MKRNESILVYGVTGLLLVILVVAVVFGGDGHDLAIGGADPRVTALGDAGLDGGVDGGDAVDLESLMNIDPARGVRDADRAPGGSELGEAIDGAAPLALDSGVSPGAGLGKEPESAVDAAMSRRAGSVAAVPAGAAGTVRLGDYRQVTVRSGDSFSFLVQRWCGDLRQLALAEALNEDLDTQRLPVGRKILLPWIDDADLDELRRDRSASKVRLDVATGQSYRLRSGDSLWRIAVEATGSQGAAPGYITRIMELNPGLVPEKLRVGQEIVLPR